MDCHNPDARGQSQRVCRGHRLWGNLRLGYVLNFLTCLVVVYEIYVCLTNVLFCLAGGHSNKTKVPLKSGFKFNSDRETWSTSDVPEMNEARKDHACLFIQVMK